MNYHTSVSLIKSLLRLIAAACIAKQHPIFAFMFFTAEILGILEELKP